MSYDKLQESYESKPSSHKFGHNSLTEALWNYTLNGFSDEEAGTVDDIGWHALVNLPDGYMVPAEDMQDGESYTISPGTYIVMSDSQGFVYHEAYDYQSPQANEEWRKILAMESDFLTYEED